MSPTPKVLLITARSDLGGGPRHVLDLLRGFEPGEIRFFVAAPEQRPFAPLFREHCEQFVEIPERSFSPLAFASLARLVYSQGIDIIHSHGRGAGLFSRPLGLLTGRPILHSFHGVHAASGTVGRLKLIIDQALALLPFHAIFSSEAERDRAIAYCVCRNQSFSVIANAVDLKRFSVDREMPNANPTPRVGIFLRADAAKGPDLWLRLIKEAKMEPSLQRTAFTCAGVSVSNLAKFGTIPENLEVVGPLENPVPWLESLSVFVSTSRSEGLPLGVLEAMAARVPCLLSKISGHETFFAHETALPFDASDPRSFSTELQLILQDPDAASIRAARAYAWVKSEFSLESFKHRLKELYFSSIGES